MLIVNADDFGKNPLVTDRTIVYFKKKAISSTSAMMFMEDSERAAELAKESGIDVGLHLNFTQRLSPWISNVKLCEYHEQILAFLTKSKYSLLLFNPFLRKQFEYVFQRQMEEFQLLYGFCPSHINGHHHMHLCSNVLISRIIPERQKIRRNFSYDKSEKNLLKRMYRRFVDKRLTKKYIIADYLFSLAEVIKSNQTKKVYELAKSSVVELETHPDNDREAKWLDENASVLSHSTVILGNYSQLKTATNV